MTQAQRFHEISEALSRASQSTNLAALASAGSGHVTPAQRAKLETLATRILRNLGIVLENVNV